MIQVGRNLIGGSSENVDLTPFESGLRTLASEGLQLGILMSGVRILDLQETYEEPGT